MNGPGERLRRVGACGGVLAIGLLAAWLRVTGVTFGLPAVYNPDEIAILSRALAFATGDLNPHNFLYPTFFFYVLFAWIGAWFVVARAVGIVPSLEAFQTSFFVDPSNVYLAGRLLGVVCGVAGVFAVWWFARRLFGRGVGLAAALFLAVAPTAVRDAHYIKHDVPVTLAVVLAMVAMARVWPVPDRGEAGRVTGRAAVAGAATGLAFSIHYYAVFLAAPLVWATLRSGGPWRRALGLAALATTVTFFALSPFLLFETGTAWQDIVANRRIVVDRSGAVGGLFLPSATAYARMLWREALGWPAVLLAAWGTLVAWRLSHAVATWLLLFPALFLLFISHTVAASRYLNPVLPFLAILAALAVHDLAVRLAPSRRQLAAGALVAMAAWPAYVQSRALGHFLQQDDTRTQAARYIERHVPSGSTLLIQPYSVQLVQSRDSLVEALTYHLGDPRRASTKFTLRLALDPWPAPAYRTLYLGEGGLDVDKIYLSYREVAGREAPATLRRFGVHYVVLRRYNSQDSATAPLRRTLEGAGRLVARFSPYRRDAGLDAGGAVAPFLHNTDTPLDPALERPGPTMEIWAIR
jgi:hypothetical protein